MRIKVSRCDSHERFRINGRCLDCVAEQIAAQGIEAAIADETQSGSAVGESPVRDSECAQKDDAA
jgi:hypothetical protein